MIISFADVLSVLFFDINFPFVSFLHGVCIVADVDSPFSRACHVVIVSVFLFLGDTVAECILWVIRFHR